MDQVQHLALVEVVAEVGDGMGKFLDQAQHLAWVEVGAEVGNEVEEVSHTEVEEEQEEVVGDLAEAFLLGAGEVLVDQAQRVLGTRLLPSSRLLVFLPGSAVMTGVVGC